MKKSNRNLLIIFSVLIVALVVVQFTKRGNKSRDLRDTLVNIDTAKVTQIKITSKSHTVLLTKDNHWNVYVDNVKKKTKKNAASSLLQTLSIIQPDRLAARKKENWKDFSVDSSGTRVQIFDNETSLLDIVIGKFGVEGQRSFYTYVRLFEDNNVYASNNFMGMNVFTSPNDYRNDMVLNLNKDSLTAIRFEYPEESFILSNQGVWMINDELADSAAVANYLQSLSYLTSKSFYEDAINVPSNQQITFSFSNAPDMVVDAYFMEGLYHIKTSENTDEIFADTLVTEKILKNKAYFLSSSVP